MSFETIFWRLLITWKKYHFQKKEKYNKAIFLQDIFYISQDMPGLNRGLEYFHPVRNF